MYISSHFIFCVLLTTIRSLVSVITFIPGISFSANIAICPPTTIPRIDLQEDDAECKLAVKEALKGYHPDLRKTTDELIRFYGYTLEVHNVTTNDGYILNIHRITGRINSPLTAKRKPSVLLGHGTAGSSESWLILHGDKGLAFKLANAGYDVWLGNARGTTYSLRHVTLDPEVDKRYWDFSWHEMGVSDMPAVIDKIINVSGNEKIFYVGFSLGTTQYFVSLSEIPEMNKKIEVGVMLAPAVFIGHSNTPLRLIGALSMTQLQKFLTPHILGGLDGLKMVKKLANMSVGDMCVPTAVRCGLCDNLMYFIGGHDESQVNYTNIPNIFDKLCGNTVSFKTLIHFSQLINSCKFQKYDHGVLENGIRYGMPKPPTYNVTQITAPTYLIYGDMDTFAPPVDVGITGKNMRPEVAKVIRVEWDEFNHLDFLVAKDADTLVNNKVLEIFNSFRLTGESSS